jgi:putative spermidine/putrescine transport system substrate-binding protein
MTVAFRPQQRGTAQRVHAARIAGLRRQPGQREEIDAGEAGLFRLAKITPPMQQSLGKVDDPVKKVTVVDSDTINAHRAQWDTRWNRQIER